MADIDQLVQMMARLPGLGPRSARRCVLHMLKKRETVMAPLARTLTQALDDIKVCPTCGNLDVIEPCHVCRDPRREDQTICVVEDVDDLWAMERTAGFRGRFHVLGGVLSALDGIGPDELAVTPLLERLAEGAVSEVILALSATVDGQTTAHYLAERLAEAHPDLTVTRLAHGVPVGGELDYLDEGTLSAALKARRPI
ncbi:MAG: recombination mediator RecR [Magnetovibrionaceae bacterium]